MLHVTLHHLSPDLRTASTAADPRSLGVVSPAQLAAMLEQFRSLDPVQNADAEPQVVIVSPAGKHFVRTDHGRLLLYDARDSSIPYRELPAAGIVDALAAPAHPVGALAEPTAAENPPPDRSQRRGRALAWLLLAGCALLNGYTVVSATRHEKLHDAPHVSAITDATELAALRHSTAGRYATGRAPGDRRIEIRADGHVQFARVISAGQRILGEDTYRMGRTAAGVLCLITPRHGVIEIRNIDTLVYYNDTYRRRP